MKLYLASVYKKMLAVLTRADKVDEKSKNSDQIRRSKESRHHPGTIKSRRNVKVGIRIEKF